MIMTTIRHHSQPTPAGKTDTIGNTHSAYHAIASALMLTLSAAITFGEAQAAGGSTGTAFVVNEQGFAVTNAHVIAGDGNGCRTLTARRGLQRFKARVAAGDASNDLALVAISGIEMAPASNDGQSAASQRSAAPAVPAQSGNGRFSITGDSGGGDDSGIIASAPAAAAAPARPTRSGTARPNQVAIIRAASSPIEQGEQIYALGFPFGSALSAEHKITQGIVSSTSGLRGNVTRFQMSAQINPGNSGGPVIDETGVVVGVSVSGHVRRQRVISVDAEGNPVLDVVTTASDGVKFAIRHDTLRAFLDSHGVAYTTAQPGSPQRTVDLARNAAGYTVQLICMH